MRKNMYLGRGWISKLILMLGACVLLITGMFCAIVSLSIIKYQYFRFPPECSMLPSHESWNLFSCKFNILTLTAWKQCWLQLPACNCNASDFLCWEKMFSGKHLFSSCYLLSWSDFICSTDLLKTEKRNWDKAKTGQNLVWRNWDINWQSIISSLHALCWTNAFAWSTDDWSQRSQLVFYTIGRITEALVVICWEEFVNSFSLLNFSVCKYKQ